MIATRQPAARPFAAWRWLIVAFRIAAMLGVLALSVLLYVLFIPLARHNPIPPRFLTIIGWLAGLRLTIIGQRPKGASFLVANHVSWLDIPALAHAAGSAFIAHDGLASIGPLRWLCELNRTVFIARHDRGSVAGQVAQISEAIADGGALTLFAEGTTSDGTGLLPFKSSLLSALVPVPPGVAIVPVWLDYGPDTARMAWVGEEPGQDNFLRILSRTRPLLLTVHFLPALSGTDLDSRKTMAAAAQGAIMRAIAARN